MKKKIGFVFSGYGSQWVGMGKDLYDQSRSVQELFEEAANCLDTNFVKLCFASSDAELSRVENAYVAIFLTSLAIAQTLKEYGIDPKRVAGYDIGEYAAIASLQGLSLPDALYLLKKHAGFYQAFLDQKQTVKAFKVIGYDKKKLEKLCKKLSKKDSHAVIALVEGSNEFIVLTTGKAGELLRNELDDAFITVEPMPIGGGFHAPIMDEIVKNMRDYLEKVDFKDVETSFVSGVIGKSLKKGEMIRAALMQHIHAQTQWHKVKDAFKDCDYILEIGPGKDLQKSFSLLYPDKKVYAINSQSDLENLKNEIAELLAQSKKAKKTKKVVQADEKPSETMKENENAPKT